MTASPSYRAFLEGKAVKAPSRGLDHVPELAPHLFPFQRHSVEFCLRVGTAGLFLDTGLGKTECQLEWCRQAQEATNGRSLILTPLAVAGQTKRRADRWGYPARVIRDQSEAGEGINICNYDRLDRLDPSYYGAVSLDEASILKSFTGKTTRALIAAFRGHRFKLAATATPAPNDHMELGNYAEFLDIMAANEMLSRWFINDTSTASQEWRLKGHAAPDFWRWMASWSRMAEKPSDLGDSDEGFDLPPFEVFRHRAKDSQIDNRLADLFGTVKMTATSMYDVKRQTAGERAKLAAEIVKAGLFEEETCEVGKRSTESGETDTSAIQNTAQAACHKASPTKTSESGTSQNTTSETKTDGVSGRPKSKPNTTPSSAPATHPIPSTGSDERPPPSHATKRSGGNPGSMQHTESRCTTTALSCSNRTEPAPSVEPENRADGLNSSSSTTATRPAQSGGCSAIPATSPSDISATIPKTASGQRTTSQNIQTWVLWCDTNDEQKLLEAALGDLCISIYGSQSAEEKENLHLAWLRGERPVLVTKPSIFGYGLDWSHCARMAFVGRSYSYETWYQAVRRCWRYGQKRKLHVHLIVAEGESEIGRVIDRKAGDHSTMKASMRKAMREALSDAAARKAPYEPTYEGRLPQWLCAA